MQNKIFPKFMIQAIKLGVFDVFDFVGTDFSELVGLFQSLSLSFFSFAYVSLSK